MSKEDFNKIVNNVEKIASALTDEQKTQLGETLSSIKYNAQGLSDDVGTLLKETMNRKEKIRELENNVSVLSQEKEKLSNTDQVSELNKRIEELQGFKTQVFEEKKKGYIDTYKKVKDHPDFEKLKDKILIPIEKDGKFTLDGEDSQIISGLDKINEYQNLGLFQQKQTRQSYTPVIVDNGDVDPVQLAKENPEAYKEYRKQQGFK